MFCWKRHWDRDSGKPSESTLEDIGSDDEEDLETCKSLQDHIPPLCVCLREGAHVQARTHVRMKSLSCVTRHMYPLSLRARNNEPVSCALTSCFIHPAWSSAGRGDSSSTERHVPPTAAKQQSMGSHVPHTQVMEKAVRYANVSEASEFIARSPRPSLSGSRDFLKLCHESMKSCICVPLCKQLLDLITLFYES